MNSDLYNKLEQQNREIEELKALLTQQELLRSAIACLGKLHIAVYDINLLTGTYKEVSVITDIPRFSPYEGVFSTTLEEILTYTIGANYRESMRYFLDLSTMADRLQDKDIINIRFQNVTNKWREATIIAHHRDGAGRAISVLYLTTDIDSFKRKELDYQKALEDSNRQKDDYLKVLLKERQEKEAYYFKSRLDLMTGTCRKMVFYEDAQKYLDEYPDKRIGLLFLDIDNFKNVNDAFGHQFGDTVIISVAEVLRTSLANKDLICRFGGDEFCVLMKDVTLEKLEDKMQFISNKLKEVFDNTKAKNIVSCSIGVVFRAAGTTSCKIDELIELADKEVYKCKAAGKNQCSLTLYKSL